MLAQNFKTPADLKIADAEFEALVKVLGMLERGEIKSVPAEQLCRGIGREDAIPEFFDMQYVHTKYDCGTAACVMGWMMHVDERVCGGGKGVLKWSPALRPLFILDGLECRDADQAAIAVRNYLTHGEPRWAEALAE